MKLGKRIKELRQKAGWTQTKLAELMSLSPGHVANWEREFSNPNPKNTKKLVCLFGEYLTPMPYNTFGSRLTYIRKIKGITQAELADAMGVGQTTVSAWEKGKMHPSADNLHMLKAVLNCPNL